MARPLNQDHRPVAEQSLKAKASASSVFTEEELASEDDLAAFASSKPYQLPVLADSILERGMSLIGTRYRLAVPPKPVSTAAVSLSVP
jgi:hypothetical protein